MNTRNAESARNALLIMAGADFSKVDKSRESDPRRQALSTEQLAQEVLQGHRGSAAREAPGPPVVSVKDLGDEGFVVGGPHGGGGGHHGGGHHGGGHHGGHWHGRGGRGRGRGWGPWPWGGLIDTGPAYVLDMSDTDQCDGQGRALYMPSGEPVCPGDPRYEALARAHARASLSSTGSTASGRDFAIGDFGCSNVDISAWMSANRVRLHPGERHRWLLAISTTGRLSNMSADELRTDIEGGVATGSIFGRWFEKVNGIPLTGDLTDTRGSVDNVKLLTFGDKATMLAVADKAGLVIEQRAEDLPGASSLLVKEPKVYAMVEFVYRSVDSSMPWPVYNDNTLVRKWCPIDAQVALSVTFKQSADSKTVPKETSLTNPSTYLPVPSTEEIAKAASDVASGIAKGAGEAASGIGSAIMYLGLGAVAIAAAVMLKK
jgi:hypothetical protein